MYIFVHHVKKHELLFSIISGNNSIISGNDCAEKNKTS